LAGKNLHHLEKKPGVNRSYFYPMGPPLVGAGKNKTASIKLPYNLPVASVLKQKTCPENIGAGFEYIIYNNRSCQEQIQERRQHPAIPEFDESRTGASAKGPQRIKIVIKTG